MPRFSCLLVVCAGACGGLPEVISPPGDAGVVDAGPPDAGARIVVVDAGQPHDAGVTVVPDAGAPVDAGTVTVVSTHSGRLMCSGTRFASSFVDACQLERQFQHTGQIDALVQLDSADVAHLRFDAVSNNAGGSVITAIACATATGSLCSSGSSWAESIALTAGQGSSTYSWGTASVSLMNGTSPTVTVTVQRDEGTCSATSVHYQYVGTCSGTLAP